MEIDLPLCNLKTCRYSFYGNCTNKNKYDVCEYAFLKSSMKRIVERLEEYRDDFMDDVYDELRDDSDNLRANRIIERFDETIEIVKEEGAV